MSLLPRNTYSSGNSFHPLFRLLDDYSSYSGQTQNSRSQLPSFQPKFDVREVEDAYELHGELAGINKEDVHIEFTDPHTLHIRGRIERSYTSGTPPAGLIQDNKAQGAITDSGKKTESSTPAHGHKVTVEDENAPATTSESGPAENDKKSENDKPTDNAKYWVSERSIGEFSRTFSFPGQVQQDAVTASLNDGILTVRVPKTPKTEGRRRIQIN